MTDFEFLYAFFGLLIGLIVAQLATRFTDAIEERQDRPIGLLTPLLAFFVLLDITSFWLIAWSVRDVALVSWRTVFVTMTMAMVYFMAASLVLPRSMAKWDSLDNHYWHRKRLVLGGILFVNLVITGVDFTRSLPSPSDLWFFIMHGSYYGALIALLLSRVRWLDLTMLSVLIANMVLGGFQLVPHSNWAESVKVASTPRSH